MTLYQQLKGSGNPQAAVQTVISLLETHRPQEVAHILGISVRWVYELRKRWQQSGGNLSACVRPFGPKRRMPNRTPEHLEALVVMLARETNLGQVRLAYVLSQRFGITRV